MKCKAIELCVPEEDKGSPVYGCRSSPWNGVWHMALVRLEGEEMGGEAWSECRMLPHTILALHS